MNYRSSIIFITHSNFPHPLFFSPTIEMIQFNKNNMRQIKLHIRQIRVEIREVVFIPKRPSLFNVMRFGNLERYMFVHSITYFRCFLNSLSRYPITIPDHK